MALVGGAGGINTGGTLPIDAATALVTQITATICPALKTVTGAIITLPVPTNLLSALLRGAIQTVVAVSHSCSSHSSNYKLTERQLLGVLIGTLPLGVIVTPAITCLNSLIPPTILPTSGSATIPLEAAVF